MKTKRIIRIAIVGGLALTVAACGVKGPPLPPVADTPGASDRADVSISEARPSTRPSSLPKTTSQTKSTH